MAEELKKDTKISGLPEQEAKIEKTNSEEKEPAKEEEKETKDEKKTYYFLMLYSNSDNIKEKDVFEVYNQLQETIKEKKENININLILDSFGGDPYAACKIAHLLRDKCNSLTAVIPFKAKSAATLMSFGCDEIVMGLQSELGPLDLPYEHPLLAGKKISACDVINSLDDIHNTSKKLALDEFYGAVGKIYTGMSKKDILDLVIRWSVDLVKPLLEKEDPRVIYECRRLLNIASNYGQELLTFYMFRDLPDWKREAKVKEIVENFIWEYPDHSYAILRHIARKIGLKIRNSEDFGEWNNVWYIFNRWYPLKNTIILLLDENQFLKFSKKEGNK